MVSIVDDELTLAEAAASLRVAPSTVRRWIREGCLPASRVGGRRLALRRADVAAMVTPVRAAGSPSLPLWELLNEARGERGRDLA